MNKSVIFVLMWIGGGEKKTNSEVGVCALVLTRSAGPKACVFVLAVLKINAERRTMQLVC